MTYAYFKDGYRRYGPAVPGCRVPIEHVQKRSVDFLRARADLTLSKKVLGYESGTTLPEGLQWYVTWCRGKNQDNDLLR